MARRGFLPLLLAPLASCATAYVPGTLAEHANIYDSRKVGCLEVGLRPLRDPVLAITFANMCHYPVGVDFRNLQVRAWSADGVEYRPAVSDPRRELVPAAIDAHAVAHVAVDFPTPVTTPYFCVELSRFNIDQPSPVPVEMCFFTDGASVAPVSLSQIDQTLHSQDKLMSQSEIEERAHALVQSIAERP